MQENFRSLPEQKSGNKFPEFFKKALLRKISEIESASLDSERKLYRRMKGLIEREDAEFNTLLSAGDFSKSDLIGEYQNKPEDVILDTTLTDTIQYLKHLLEKHPEIDGNTDGNKTPPSVKEQTL